MSNDIEILRQEARYRRERVALQRAKSYRGRPVMRGRLEELEREAAGAEARLKRAEARQRSAPTTKGTT